MKIAVVDIETTGFVTDTDAILEIGITLVDTATQKLELIFDKVILDPVFEITRHNNAWIFQNSDLKPVDVLNADTLETLTPELQAIFDKYKVTAHNKPFDLCFLRSRGFVIDDVKCIMKSCRENKLVLDHTGKTKAPSVEEVYSVFFPHEQYIEKHRGGDDSLHEGKILLKLCDIKAGKLKPEPLIVDADYLENKRAKKYKKKNPKNFFYEKRFK